MAPIDDFGPVLACKNVLNVTTTSRCDNRSLPSFPSSRAEILLISIASRHGHTKAGGSLWRPYRYLCHPPEEAATTSEGGRRRDTLYIAIAPNNDISAQYVCNVCMGHAYNGLLVSCLPEEGTSEATLTSHWRPYRDLLHSPEEGGRLFYRRTNQVRVWPP